MIPSSISNLFVEIWLIWAGKYLWIDKTSAKDIAVPAYILFWMAFSNDFLFNISC